MVSVLRSSCSALMQEALPSDKMPEMENNLSEGTLVAGQASRSSATSGRSVAKSRESALKRCFSKLVLG